MSLLGYGKQAKRSSAHSASLPPTPQNLREVAGLWAAGLSLFNCQLLFDLVGQPFSPELYSHDPADPALALRPELAKQLKVRATALVDSLNA
jgi:hypothetical protein